MIPFIFTRRIWLVGSFVNKPQVSFNDQNGKQLYDVMVERAGPSKTSGPKES